jgi:ribosome-binding factor A
MGVRLLRINESIREILSSVIATEGLKDPRVGFVTVTGVDTSSDLRHAKVYVSVLGDQLRRDETMAALEKARGFLQVQVNERLRLKRTPQLQFLYDGTTDNAMHIDALIRKEEAVLGSEPPEIVVDGVDEREDPAPDEAGDDKGEQPE